MAATAQLEFGRLGERKATPRNKCARWGTVGARPVMPAKAGIHAFPCCDKDKSWMPAFAGMTDRPVAGTA